MVRRLLACAVVATALMLGLGMTGCGGGDESPSAASGATPAVSGAPRHVIYFSEFQVRTVLERLLPNGPGPLERIDTYRQMPAPHTVLPPQYRIARVDGEELAPMSAEKMAARLRRAINHTCTAAMPCTAHLVAIDDIDVEFRGHSGTRLLAAMRLLDAPSPWGSTYAKRVMMYVPIQMVDAVGDRALWREWADAAKAVGLGESYWIEMYRSTGAGHMGDVDYGDWTTGVRRMMGAIEVAGGSVARAHFMVGPGVGAIEGMPQSMCPEQLGCAWQAVMATPLNRRINGNGVGIYRFGPAQLAVLCVRAVEEHDPQGEDRLTHDTVVALCSKWTSSAPQVGRASPKR